jgi:2-oxoglutarate ferredoxin oxidoreductase subunit beta
MNWQKFINQKAQPFGWCSGCGLYGLFSAVCQELGELELSKTVVVSGIGCAGRGAGYFNLDTVHGLHGRAIPIAIGIKRANPKLKVIVFSGDGDLLGIGGNHLLHAAIRNDDLTVVCNVNEVFGMTGGQASPTTPLGAITATTPRGNTISPINIQGILLSNPKYFYARSSPVFNGHLRKCLKEAIGHRGFSFVENISPCIVNYARKMNKDIAEISEEIKNRYTLTSGNRPLSDSEMGIVKK